VRQHAPSAAEKHLNFTWQIPTGEDLIAQVHPADLRDCIANLVENAIKYTPDGGRVQVTVAHSGQTPRELDLPPPPPRPNGPLPEDYSFVIVQDTGIGLRDSGLISANGAPAEGTIFDAFRRGEAAVLAGIPGSGLGLSIVREVVEQAGGYIHVRSRPGVGSTFAVAFPIATSPIGTPVRDTRSSAIVVESGNTPPTGSSPDGASSPATPV
jgi:signal transduction histidine kinase